MKIKPIKYVSADDLKATIAYVSDIAKAEKKRVVLIGGSAMQVYGSDRLTTDVDFAADELLDGIRGRKTLTFGGIQTKAPNGVSIDFIVRGDQYRDLYSDAIRQARTAIGLSMRVASPEHLLAMKMEAGREKDHLDIVYLLNSGHLSLGTTRSVIREHLGPYAVSEFNSLVEEAAWMKTRKSPRARRRTRR
jgi:hypothetical protein